MAPWILQISSSCSETEKEESIVDLNQPLITLSNTQIMMWMDFFFTQKLKFSSSISHPCFIHFLHSVEYKRRILYKESGSIQFFINSHFVFHRRKLYGFGMTWRWGSRNKKRAYMANVGGYGEWDGARVYRWCCGLVFAASPGGSAGLADVWTLT